MPNLIGGAGQIELVNARVGPCPNCGGIGTIPDGIYDFTESSLSILSTWHPDRLRRFADAIGAARRAPDPRAAVEATLAQDPDLAAIARRLSPLSDASAFWGFIAVLLTTITLLTSRGDTVVNEKTVIEHLNVHPAQVAPQEPQATHDPPETVRKPPPPPPRKKGNGKSRKRSRR